MKFQLNYVLLRTVLNNELQCAIACFVMLHSCSCFSERKQKKRGARKGVKVQEPQHIFYKSNSWDVEVQPSLILRFPNSLCVCLC